MLHILYTIGYILGIILLVLLLLFIFILGVVLFWPIKYCIKGKIDKDCKEIEGKASWLFGILTIQYGYPSEEGKVIRLFGKKLSSKKKDDTDNKKQEVETKNNDEEMTDSRSGSEKQKVLNDKSNPSVQQEEIFDSNLECEHENKTTFFEKIKNRILGIWFKIKDIYAKIDKIKGIIEKEENKALFGRILTSIGKVFKHIKPRTFRLNLLMGFDKPDLTGKIYGLYWSLKPYLSKETVVIPDFDQQILEGKLYIKGYITLFVLVVQCLKIYFDKGLKDLLRQWNTDERGVHNNGKEQSV